MIFESVAQFRKAVRKYAFYGGHDVKFKQNDGDRVRVVCRKIGCKWLLFAAIDSSINNLVKTYKEKHLCARTNRVTVCNSDYITTHFHERIASQPNIQLHEIRRLNKELLYVKVGMTSCARAKPKVLKKVVGILFLSLRDCTIIVRRLGGLTLVQLALQRGKH